MALVLADRVQETSTTSGTGTLSLAGAAVGYQSFISGIGGGNTTYYVISDTTANVWEVGLGTVTAGSPNTLSRTTILANSSGTTSPLALAGNTVSVWCDYPASKAVYKDANGDVTLSGALNVTGATTLATSLTGLLKTASGVVSNAASGTDYAPATSGTALLKGNGAGGFSSAAAGTDYLAPPSGTAILKANSGGALANAVSGTDYAPATSGSSILSGSGSGGFSNVTIGTGLSFSGGTLSNTITAPFAAGTAIVFAQAAAPTGWTKSTTHDNKALRLVSGTGGGSGGSVAFTTAFASQTPSGSINTSGLSAGATTLSLAQIPGHNHTGAVSATRGNGTDDPARTPNVNLSNVTVGQYTNGNYVGTTTTTGPSIAAASFNVASNGSGSSHTHTVSGSATFAGNAINLAVQYVDVIIATKD